MAISAASQSDPSSRRSVLPVSSRSPFFWLTSGHCATQALAFVHPSPPPAELPPNYFVDDSLLNVTAAQLLGWNSIHYKESGEWDTDHGRVNNLPVKNANGEEINVVTVDDLEGLRDVWKELFL